MDVGVLVLAVVTGLGITGAVWLLVQALFWWRDRRAARREEDRRRAEQFRREFSSALRQGAPAQRPVPPPRSGVVSGGGTIASTGPATATAIAQALGIAVPRPAVVRNKNDESYFAGRGETHGIVYGMRNFKVDRLFRLTAYIYPSWVWKPGENVARCLRMPSSAYSTVSAPGFPADHPMTGCLHGFYAYYDGSRDYHEKGDVTGIIKGWGEAVVGDKGFRVMRAEIVAMKFSGSIASETKRRVMRNYPDVAVFDTVEDMLREFPTSAGGLEYVPEADDDFWTREA